VEGGVSCSRTRPENLALADLRVLRQGPPATGARVIGYVRGPEAYAGGLTPPTPPRMRAGARILLAGPVGTRTIETDHSGVYQQDDLPPGDYTLELIVPDNQVVGFFESEPSPARVRLEPGGVAEHNFDVYWNGRIQGRVLETSGRPARIWVKLESADGRRLPGYVKFFVRTDRDGSYEINRVPPGRYVVWVNPSGPSQQSPYDIQYYPSARRLRDAKGIDMSEGQQFRGIDFRLQLLAERTVQVRVSWPDGSTGVGASVCVAYEHTRQYGSLESTDGTAETDKSGLAVVKLYGSSRVRLFARRFVDKPEGKERDRYYSQPVESEIGKLADRVDLVLTSPRP
jgi:hypothetical protein